jgi:molybdenum cofactor cytidylyltransferase
VKKKMKKDRNTENRIGVGCVIMASGQGLRFGGNKLMADFDGEPMLCRSLRATDGLFADRIVVTRHKEIEELCQKMQIRVLYHCLPYRSDTIRLGLEALDGHLKGCMFCPGDQPLLTRETLHGMLTAAEQEPDRIWRLTDGRNPGMPVIFPAWCFEELLHLSEKKGGSAVMRSHPESVKLFSASHPYELMDVDCPADLERLILLQKQLAQPACPSEAERSKE